MKILDIYGEDVKILLNKNNKIKTSIGGIFTIMTIMLVLVFTWFIGKDIIYKEKPISYMQSDIFEKFLQINVSSNNFPFSFTMMDDFSTPLLDFTYLTIKLYELTYDINLDSGVLELTEKKDHPLKFCNYSDFKLISQEQFYDAQLGYTLCPLKNNFNLYGYWSEAHLNFLQISIESCKNKTDSQIICKSPDEIVKYIADTSVNMNIFFVDSRVLINNNTNTIEFLTTTKYKYVIPEYYKKTTFKIQTQNIFTDDGLIFSDTKNVQFFKMVEDFTDLSITDTFQNQFLAFEIFSSNISDSYFRRYIKLPDIIASLGGILKVFTITFLYMNSIFSKVEKNKSIVNEVFVINKKFENNLILKYPNKNFKKDCNSIIVSEKNILRSYDGSNLGIYDDFRNHKFNKKNINKKSVFKRHPPISSIENTNINKDSYIGKLNFHNIYKNFKISKNDQSDHKIDKDIQLKVQKYFELRKSQIKIKFNFKDKINIICNNYCKKKIPNSLLENFNFYKKAKNSVEHYFDIIFMIQKFEEINILKNCLLTPEQSKMVEIMRKPILSSKEFEKDIISLKDEENADELSRDVDCFLLNIKLNKINRKIMNMIEENLKKSHI